MRKIEYQVRAPKGDRIVDAFNDETKAKSYIKDRRPIVGNLRLLRVITTVHELTV